MNNEVNPEQIESISTQFNKISEDTYFMKENITKIKPYEAKMEFQNCHIAISKNGGLVAFMKKANVFLVSKNDIIRDNIRIFTQNGGKEIRIPFHNPKNQSITLFEFTDDERLIAIMNNGMIFKFDITTKNFSTRKTDEVFNKDPIETAKFFGNGFVALTQQRDFYIINSLKEPITVLFFPFGNLKIFDVKPGDFIKDFVFLPADSTRTGRIELFFSNPKGHGVVHVIEQPDNKFVPQVLKRKSGNEEDIMFCEGVEFIKSHREEVYTKHSGKDTSTHNDLGKICAFALSPDKSQFAMYRNDGTVFFFKSNFNKERMKANYTINEKDSDKDRQEQKSIISFPPNTQFVYCGNDAVCLCGKRFVLLINEESKPLIYRISSKSISDSSASVMQCITEIDGLRVLTNDAVFLISRVPQEMLNSCYTFSEDCAKKLIKAYKSAEDKQANCDKEIRDISEILPLAVDSLQKASACIWRKDYQLYMLKAAQHGKSFVQKDEFNFSEFVEVCKDIRIINNLRTSEIPRYITFYEYKKMKKKELINRLIRTEDFFMAFEVSKYLGLRVKKVYQKFAIAQIKKLSNGLSAEEEIEHYNILQKKLANIPGISYIKLAEKSFKYNKKEIGMKFLDNEKSILTKIPQYLELKEWKKALELALETYDNNVLITVMDKIIKMESVRAFLSIVTNHEKAHSTVVGYLKKNLPTELEQYLLIKGKFEDLLFYNIERFFNSVEVSERRSCLQKAQESVKRISSDKVLSQKIDAKFYMNYLNDLENSLELKRNLIEENKFIKQTDKAPFDNSIFDVIYEGIKICPEGNIEKKMSKFELTKGRMNHIRLRAAIEIKDSLKRKEILRTLVNDMKTAGLQPINFAEVYMELDMKDEACKMIKLINEPDFFDYKVEMLRHMKKNADVLEVIIAEKNQPRKVELVNEILNKYPDLRRKAEELKEKYGEKF